MPPSRADQQQRSCTRGDTAIYFVMQSDDWMRSKRLGMIVVALLAAGTSAVIVLKGFRSATTPAPPAAVRKTPVPGLLSDTISFASIRTMRTLTPRA